MSTTTYNDEHYITSSYTLTQPSHLPPCILSKRVKWDVFLSFRGEDTRKTITKSLCAALSLEGLRVFIDDVGMAKGDKINPCLEEGIVDSALAVAIISPKYADSRWCLHELCELLRSRKRVIPVFYMVNPSDVRTQTGDFGKGFRSLIDSGKETQSEEKEKVWKTTLKAIGNLSGYPCRSESDGEAVIQRVVKQVLRELKSPPESVAEITVGLDSRVDKVLQKLDIQSSGVRFLGIHGIPGIGKTTLAKAAFNKLKANFRNRCFISNVREQFSKKGGVLIVQNKIIRDLTTGNVTPVEQDSDAKREIKIKVGEDRVLIVLDDVSDINQLESIGIFREWFQDGSRIIITSRNEDVVVPFPCNNDELHEAGKLSDSESLELFCIHAFGRREPTKDRREPTKDYLGISTEIVALTDELPLALEVLGSSLVKKTSVEWKNTLAKLKEVRDEKLRGMLKISYDALDAQEKFAFLEISCLLMQMNMKRSDVVDILEGCGPCGLKGELAIGSLVTKSLIKISENNTLWMHDEIKEMGKQIIVGESLDDPGKRSRLWDSSDIRNVLQYDKATGFIHGIVLDENLVLHTKSFGKMKNLKLLQIDYSKLQGNIADMPSELKCLNWRGCSEKTLSAEIPEELRVLDVSESNLQQLWSSSSLFYRRSKKVAPNLVVINLSNNPSLTTLPDMSSHKHLKKLTLENCIGLTKIHDSIGNMTSLVHINLRGCSNLSDFPTVVTGMKGLKELILSGCSKFRGLPDEVRSMKSLNLLLLDGTSVVQLPNYMFHLTQLEVLNLDGCNRITRLPDWIGFLTSLKDLSLNHTTLEALPESIGSLSRLEKLSLVSCSSLVTIPDSVQMLKSLVELYLTDTSLEELHPSICSLSYLKVLSLGQCCSLLSLPGSVEGLASITELNLESTSITNLPEEIQSLKFLEKLDLKNCKKLTTLPESIGELSNLTILLLVGTAIKKLPDSIGELENLEILNLGYNDFESLPSTLEWLCFLRTLILRHCENLRSIPRLSSSLEVLICADCYALESICDFSNLCCLRELQLANCYKLADVPGLQCTKSV